MTIRQHREGVRAVLAALSHGIRRQFDRSHRRGPLLVSHNGDLALLGHRLLRVRPYQKKEKV